MAEQTYLVSSANGGLVKINALYDDVTLKVDHLELVNNGTSGTLTATLFSVGTQTPIFGPTTRSFGTGTFSIDVTGQNWVMAMRSPYSGKAARLMPPWDWSLEWSS